MLRALIFILYVVGNFSYAVDDFVPLRISEVESKYGIRAWFVPRHNIPVVFYTFIFKNAGYAYDPKGKLGLAAIVTGILNEGPSHFTNKDFARTIESIGGRITYHLEAKDLVVNVSAPRESIRGVVELFCASVAKPKLDDETLSKVKGTQISQLKNEEGDPLAVAKTEFFKAAFSDSGYSNKSWGRIETVNAIKPEDIKTKIANIFNRINMRIVVLGSTEVNEIKSILDDYLIEFPLVMMEVKILERPVLPAIGKCISIEKNIPQNIILFGHRGLNPLDNDFYNLVILSHILGDDGLESLLMKEIREKRGYTYGINTRVQYSPANLLFGVVSTSNATAYEVKEEIVRVMNEVKRSGFDSMRIEDAKNQLIDRLFLKMDTLTNVLELLTEMQQRDLGIDYLQRYLEGIRKVEPKMLNLFVKRFLDPQSVLFVNVGVTVSPKTGAKVCQKS